ncbi:hypothetical protein CEK29_13060 [Bordetella genomosp. 5]|uniref:oxidoreductase-like domain-containing protein n=1 Tax=Bordetella genomosp. 5 TaxID=1395608 RepID=UPI000B9ED474|nr:oxidoreductase-like domain-containing protein [Bordetella genomosp. 5]OZI42295.1 hypothetical protein CEK29_13060 [Bordetella genomosp. 5]
MDASPVNSPAVSGSESEPSAAEAFPAGTPGRVTDPRPLPPEPPLPGDCCQSGCIPCVYDLYEEARERYLVALQAWEARQHGE